MNNISEYLKIEEIDRYDDINLKDYSYAFITMLSEVVLKEISEIEDINWDEVIDIRLFDDKKELHMWNDGELHGVIVTEIEETKKTEENKETKSIDYIDKTYVVMKNISDKKLKIRKYISYDHDGQAYISLTRMIRLV